MSGTENPPTAPGDEVIPGARTAPARVGQAETAADVAPLIEKEIG
jgi:hypothetical protein